MILALLLQAAVPATPSDPRERQCLAEAKTDAVGAERSATAWRGSGGGYQANRCLGVALAAQQRFAAAGAAFEEAAHGAATAKDQHAADDWAAAGNAWLASGDAARARTALDAALAAGTLDGLARGEALLDRARTLVAAGDTKAARTDLDLALQDASDDLLAWLLSATLARRMSDLPRAQHDIGEALRLSGDDASVQLEAGNIAAAGGDAEGAKTAWTRAAQIAPDKPAGQSATRALAQFATPAGK